MFTRRLTVSLLFLVLAVQSTAGQQIIVQPFLQQATSNSIWVVWETNQGSESRVDFGLTAFGLDQSQTGTAIPNVGGSIIHQVRLTGLEAKTRYFYRVRTGSAVSAVFDFRTPAESDSGYPVRFAAYSDSQFDGAKSEQTFGTGQPRNHSLCHAKLQPRFERSSRLCCYPRRPCFKRQHSFALDQSFFWPSTEFVSPCTALPGSRQSRSRQPDLFSLLQPAHQWDTGLSRALVLSRLWQCQDHWTGFQFGVSPADSIELVELSVAGNRNE